MVMFQDSKYKVGDLVKIATMTEEDNYVFRPHNFPYGNVGLVVLIENDFHNFLSANNRSEYSYYPYPYYGDDYYWEFQEIYVVLIDGEKWWLFEEELELYTKDEQH